MTNKEIGDRENMQYFNNGDTKRGRKRIRSIGFAFIPFVILAVMIYFLSSPYSQYLINPGIPLPEITVEKIEFHENQIIAFIRNTGPETISIYQADINDRVQAAAIEPSKTLHRLAEAKVIIPFLWNPAEPYEIGITTSDGTRFSKIAESAALTPIPNAQQLSVFAILGTYVGVIPVMIGLAWYPFMRKISTRLYNFFLSLTAGLLVFLGIEAVVDSNEIATANVASTFNGPLLIFIISMTSFLILLYVSERFTKKAIEKISKKPSALPSRSEMPNSLEVKNPAPKISNDSLDKNNGNLHPQEVQLEQERQQQIIRSLAMSLMVAMGIGLHNFGEGLAIGAAVLLGEVALSTFLIIGFTIHNTTEGLAIIAPLAKTGKLMIRRLLLLGLVAGVPTILGTWMGGFIYSPIASIVFLSIGAGAIFQVVYSIIRWMTFSSANRQKKEGGEITSQMNVEASTNPSPSASMIAGFIVGLLIMYLTGLLV
jgi:ZIP family zinc transporter